MRDLIHDLESLGFSKKEAAVYIAALEFGVTGAQNIGRKSGINRATTYSILELLASKGLITPLVHNGDKRYRAESPQRILTLLDLQERELEHRRRIADQLMLRLQVFHNSSSSKPIIKYRESIEGLRAVQKEYEALNEDIIQIVGFDTLMKLYSKSPSKEHMETMKERKRVVRSIVVSDESHESLIPFREDEDCVVVPSDLIDVKGEMTVCGDRLVLFSYTSGMIAVDIHSKTIADTARATLELAWQRAKEWEKQNTRP